MVRLVTHEAEMTSLQLGNASIIIDHTEVLESSKGRGIGRALVQRAVEHARAEGRKFVSLCQGTDRPASRLAERAVAEVMA